MKGSYLGPSYSQTEIETELKNINANFEVLDENNLIEKTAECLKNGDAVGWFQNGVWKHLVQGLFLG